MSVAGLGLRSCKSKKTVPAEATETSVCHGAPQQIVKLRLDGRIQRHFDQRQVPTIYLNRVYFDENAYGVEDASMRYFGQHAADLR